MTADVINKESQRKRRKKSRLCGFFVFFPLCSLVGSEVSDSLGPPHIGVSLRQSHRQKGCRISCMGS